jgi:murein DD-endopeptidase MepM/ murein hydrolase activator NlpD
MRIKHILTGDVPSFKSSGHRAVLSFVTLGFTVAASLIFAASTPISAVADGGVKVSDLSFMVAGRLSAPFGNRYDPFKTGKAVVHNGIDIAAPLGTPIYAPDDGVILAATDLYDGKPAYGKVLVFQSSRKTQTLFAHLDGYQVQQGQHIQKGIRIASVGNTGKSTGPHVHVETFIRGERVDPLTVWPVQQ